MPPLVAQGEPWAESSRLWRVRGDEPAPWRSDSRLPAPCPVPSCTCEMPETATEARQHAAAVFTAVVDLVGDTLVTEATSVGQRMQLAHLWVTRVWKGSPPRMLRMVGTQSGADCLMRFEAGREYLLYALREGEALVTSWCLRSRPVKDAEDDIAELGLAIE